MAGLALSVGISAILGVGTPAILGQTARNDKGREKQTPRIAAKDEGSPKKETAKPSLAVELQLGVAGLRADGCDVEIKPANPSCRFRPVKRHIHPSGELESFLIKDIEIRGADRNCSFAITVNEPGQKPRTILRGFRLAAHPAADQDSPAAPQKFTCWLSSPSKLAAIEESTSRK